MVYDIFNPNADDLIGYCTFDHSSDSQVLDASSFNKTSNGITSIGILNNFDTEKCWQKGLINNCLTFDGIDDYVFIHDDANNNINTVLSTSSASFSLWIKIPSDILTSATHDIISNYDDASNITDISGLFIVSLQDTGNNNQMKLKTQIRSASATGSVVGTSKINDNK